MDTQNTDHKSIPFPENTSTAAVSIETCIRTSTLLELRKLISVDTQLNHNLKYIFNTVRFSIDIENCMLLKFVNGMWWSCLLIVQAHKFNPDGEWEKVQPNDVSLVESLFDFGQDFNFVTSELTQQPSSIETMLTKNKIHFEPFRAQRGGILFSPSSKKYSPHDKDYLSKVAAIISFCLDKNTSNQHLGEIYQSLQTMLDRFHKETDQQVIAGQIPAIYQDIETGLHNKLGLLNIVRQLINVDQKNTFLVILSIQEIGNIQLLFDETINRMFLMQTIARINSVLNEDNKLSHLGSGQFAFIIPRANRDQVTQILSKLKEAFVSDLKIENYRVHCDMRAGYSCYPTCGTQPELLLKAASIALFQAKKNNIDRYQGYDDGIVKQLQLQFELARAMPSAIENNEFILYFQPVVKLGASTEHIESYEALIRWQHPEKGIIPPDKFIEIAEESGDIIPLGYWVVDQACRCLSLPSTQEEVSISINLSPVQLKEPHLVERMVQISEQYGIAPQRIVFEITENAAMQNIQSSQQAFAKFHAAGFKLSMDDFGTGYSSLSYLLNFSFDILKVDKSFIDNTLTNKSYITIGQTIVKLAHDLSLTVVCEGIETDEQLKIVTEWQTDMVQGYLFGRPKPWSDLLANQPESNKT